MIAWHPMTVHFPIAWLLLAGLCYIGRLRWPEHPLAKSSPWLHVGAVSTILLAILSGRAALDDLGELTPVARSVFDQHELGAYILLWANAMLLVWVYLRFRRMKPREQAFFALVFWTIQIGLIYQGHLGGQMVYVHGIGVGG